MLLGTGDGYNGLTHKHVQHIPRRADMNPSFDDEGFI